MILMTIMIIINNKIINKIIFTQRESNQIIIKKTIFFMEWPCKNFWKRKTILDVVLEKLFKEIQDLIQQKGFKEINFQILKDKLKKKELIKTNNWKIRKNKIVMIVYRDGKIHKIWQI